MGYLQFESENPILALPIKREQLNINDSVAQLVEQMTLNHWGREFDPLPGHPQNLYRPYNL